MIDLHKLSKQLNEAIGTTLPVASQAARRPVSEDSEEHEHQWGPTTMSRLAGTPHRKCQVPGCRAVSLDGEEDEESDLGESYDDDEVVSPAGQFCDDLHGLLADQGYRVQSFEDAGLLTRNKGLVVRTPDGKKFQLTVVHDNRGY